MADLYDYPEVYDERFTDAANAAYRQHYQKALAGKDIHSILDCSFGTGCLSFCLCELGYEVSGSDLSASMLGLAAKKAEEKGVQVDLTQCDFRTLSSHFTRQFDCVMSTGNALAHVTNDDVRKTLREMDACIRPGGYLYFDSRNWERALRERERIQTGQPFYRADGVRIGYAQVWDYHEDGSITINVLNTYERDRRIFETRKFEEHLHPFPVSLILTELKSMGYDDAELHAFPWFADTPFNELNWYCLIARKPSASRS